MLQSQLFTKTKKEAPKDEISKNAQLLERAGFIYKEMAGVYSYLPLGFRVLKKVENIIREEMNAIGGQEVFLTTLQDPEIWKKSLRWEDRSDGLPWFKTKLINGGELGIANTHEEALANILHHFVSSYKGLPLYVYQIQNKFRNELRAKSGLMRAREFLMKDLYSFTSTQEELDKFYELAAEAYLKIFDRVGLKDITFRTFASGGVFSKFSDEFQTLSSAGEDTIFVYQKKKIAINKEVYTDEIIKELGLNKKDLVEEKSIEVGNIFKLGTKYSEAEGLYFKNEKGNKLPVIMGSYGIGLGRLLATIAEIYNDKNGLVWPKSIAPFAVHLLRLSDEKSVFNESEKIYSSLLAESIEVLYDDRLDVSAGEKFSDADLIGIPIRLVVSEKSLEKGGVEVKNRNSDKISIVAIRELAKFVQKSIK